MHNVLLSNAQLNRWNIAATLINEPNSETRRKTAENGSRAKQKFGADNFLSIANVVLLFWLLPC